MKLETLDQAILEAARFVRKAKELKQFEQEGRKNSTKHSAAVRRASMDLTRILADLRNGR